ncbi:MAG TPA: hypothetical protein VE715_05960 [Blastocatellia bacterium]|nr:hypothetical protein [Blastocatellia bacterium]
MNDDVKRPRLGAIGGHLSAANMALFVCIHIHTLIGLIFPLNPAPPKIVLANHIGVGGSGYGAPVHLVNLENQSIKESSGIAASRRNTGIFWTHNDSGDGPFIYAFDRQGKHRGVWRVAGAGAVDWEDMAIGPGPIRGKSYLYIGDIGDNSKKRNQITVYRVSEPRITPKDSSSTVQNPRETDAADVIRLKYPDGKYDAETLLIHPVTGDLYIITKVMGAAARVYKLRAPAPKSGVSPLSYVGEFRFPNSFLGFVTGGDISPDGRRVVISDYLGACELILPDRWGIAFDEIWKQSPLPVDIGGFPGVRRQGEAICYRADGLAILATSEGLPCPLIEAVRSN